MLLYAKIILSDFRPPGILAKQMGSDRTKTGR